MLQLETYIVHITDKPKTLHSAHSEDLCMSLTSKYLINKATKSTKWRSGMRDSKYNERKQDVYCPARPCAVCEIQVKIFLAEHRVTPG